MEVICRIIGKNFQSASRNGFLKSIATSAVRFEQTMEELENNPYYKKYAQKIANLQHTSPEEFLARMGEQEKKKKKSEIGPEGPKQGQFTSLLKPKQKISSPIDVNDEPLDKIMKIELVRDKDVNEIKHIWEQYHIQQDVIAATVPTAEYTVISEKAKKYPLFIFPLPRTQGYEFIVSEFRGNAVHFTPLICYQVHKENAPECLTMKHYTEFKDSKGIVLMRGEFDKNVINAQEAQCLANQLQLYYGQRHPEKTKLLEQFTTSPDEFKHTDLIKQIESLAL